MVEHYRASRPEGVTILSVLWYIQAVVLLLFGLGMVAGGAYESVTRTLVAGVPDPALLGGMGLLMIVTAIIYFAVGWGLWHLRPWARTAAIIFAILGLFNFPVGTVISLVILWYLFRDEVKLAFATGGVEERRAV